MPSKPNFILIFPDQWRGDALSCLGNSVVETPFIDDLAADGVTFTAAYSACPSCIAARACLATGQSPSSTGRLGYKDGVPWRYPVTMMSELRDTGYQTINVGKTHFYPQRANLGFEINISYETQRLGDDYQNDYDAFLQAETGGQVRDTVKEINNNLMLVRPWVHEEYLHPSTWTVTAALDQLRKRDPQRPFFLQVGFHRPHPPLDPPLAYYQMYEGCELPPVPVGDWAASNDVPMRTTNSRVGHLDEKLLNKARWAYYAQCAHIDYNIGRLYHFLQRRHWLDNTWLIFCSDHGELLGDHHLNAKSHPYEGSTKIPFIIKPPTSIEGEHGVTCEAPTTHMDIMPTVLEAAGIDIPHTVEGQSLMPFVRGRKPSQWREFVHGEHTGGPANQFVTDGREKFAWYTVTGEERFFDLTTDPGECVNLVNDPTCTERVQLWRQRLIDVLSKRPQDGLSFGDKLIPGTRLPAVRSALMTAQRDSDGIIRPH